MNVFTIRINESLHTDLQRIALAERVSANQFIASAAAEKMLSIMTLDY